MLVNGQYKILPGDVSFSFNFHSLPPERYIIKKKGLIVSALIANFTSTLPRNLAGRSGFSWVGFSNEDEVVFFNEKYYLIS